MGVTPSVMFLEEQVSPKEFAATSLQDRTFSQKPTDIFRSTGNTAIHALHNGDENEYEPVRTSQEHSS